MSEISIWLASASSSINTALNSTCGQSCNKAGLAAVFTNIAVALSFLVGAASVIFIIFGGMKYVLSNGDAKQAAEAKNTILYSVLGVVVAIAAYAIIGFVNKSIGG